MVTHKGAATASGLEEIPRKQSLQTTKFIVGTSARGTRPHLFQCVKFRKQARCVCCEALVLVLHAVLKTLVWKFKMADQRCQPVLWGNHLFLHNSDFVPFVFVIQTPFTLFKPQPGSGIFWETGIFLNRLSDRDFWRHGFSETEIFEDKVKSTTLQTTLTLNLTCIGTKQAFPESTSWGIMMRGLAARTYRWRNACRWYLQPQHDFIYTSTVHKITS